VLWNALAVTDAFLSVFCVLVCTPDGVETFFFRTLTRTLKAIHFTVRTYFPSREDNLNREVLGTQPFILFIRVSLNLPSDAMNTRVSRTQKPTLFNVQNTIDFSFVVRKVKTFSKFF
jgi:hypothetical protein